MKYRVPDALSVPLLHADSVTVIEDPAVTDVAETEIAALTST